MAVFFQPVRHHQTRQVVVWVLQYRPQQGVPLGHTMYPE
ncbi:hypothetical protein FRUB_10303 [Fimbriiglobus ruber]|uniref:Uncharacterized protein n=1 Tax=Fimbriiglobus ruber TaxID=1908690 RepID=A0A225CYL6_9BACT|nr:hypothetical protein FRUB_10303 [Fimbriiglobus ruber]